MRSWAGSATPLETSACDGASFIAPDAALRAMLPPADVRDRLAKVKSASLSDALRRLHPHRHHVLDLVTPTPGRVLFGPAATMAFAPLRADVEDKASLDFPRQLAAALGGAGEGKVVVAAAYGAPDGAVAGGIRLAHLEKAGVAGLLTDGRLRDFGEAARCSFAAYCRGETIFAGSAEIMPIAVGGPVVVGGATVFPGDCVYADAAGAVVIPRRDLDRVLDLAVETEQEDAKRLAKAMQG